MAGDGRKGIQFFRQLGAKGVSQKGSSPQEKMKCDNCKKESRWLEMVGKEFICHKCLGKNKLMGLILRTHADTFTFIMKKLKRKNYQEYLKITEEDIDKVTDLKKQGIDKPKKKY